MTVILVLLFLITCLGIDAYRQHKLKHASDFVNDIMFHPEVGLTLADGGEKVEKTEEKK